MPTYLAQARSTSGQVLITRLEAESRKQALNQLAGQGLYALRLDELVAGTLKARAHRRLIAKETAFFTRQMADLLDASVPLLRALHLIREQAIQARVRDLLLELSRSIEGGKSFSEALEAYPGDFSRTYVQLVRAGESAGMLGLTLSRLAEFLEEELEFRSKILSALAYPAFVLTVGGATLAFLMFYVVPRMALVFAETGQGAPWIAQVLAWISTQLSSWPVVLLVVAISVGGLYSYRRNADTVRRTILRQIHRIPAWGQVYEKSLLARFARTLSMLLEGGVPLIRALVLSTPILEHSQHYPAMRHATRSLEEGRRFSDCLRQARLFPVFICQMIAIGEETNQLEKALSKVARTYERETDRAAALAVSLLEPLLIVAVGGVISFIVIGMLLPIFRISTLMN